MPENGVGLMGIEDIPRISDQRIDQIVVTRVSRSRNQLNSAYIHLFQFYFAMLSLKKNFEVFRFFE